MARTDNLTNFLTDVSSAIKQKTGDDTPISASEFDNKILSIQGSGIDTSDATATADDIILSKSAYVKGEKINGTLPDPENLYKTLAELPSASTVGKGIIQTVFDISQTSRFYFHNPKYTDAEFTFNTIDDINNLPYENVSVIIVQLAEGDFWAIAFEKNSMFFMPRGGGHPVNYGGLSTMVSDDVRVYHYVDEAWIEDEEKSKIIRTNINTTKDFAQYSLNTVFNQTIRFPRKCWLYIIN